MGAAAEARKNGASRGREQFYAHQGLLLALAGVYARLPLSVRCRLLERHRYTGGKLGLGLRYALLKSIAASCGENVYIGPGVFLIHPQNLHIGSNVSIQPMCYIACGSKSGPIRIDDEVSIGHGVTLMATTHHYEDTQTDVIRDMPTSAEPIHICRNVWIGAKATVLLGVCIESGCVIGAHSLVNRSTEENGVYVGAPAKRIKTRASLGE